MYSMKPGRLILEADERYRLEILAACQGNLLKSEIVQKSGTCSSVCLKRARTRRST
jgi:hypothetical protein